MRHVRRWIMRLRGLFPRQGREEEMAQEIESHLEMLIADSIQRGMTAEQARRQALLTLGGVEAMKEVCREQSTVPLLEHFLLDLRFAIRQFRNKPGFALTAVPVLGFGMCASIAIFAFVDAALIKPLPYPDPQTLMMVTETSQGFHQANLSYPDYQDWKRFNRTLRSIDVYSGTGFLLNTHSGTEPVTGGAVSGGFFGTLGVKPLLGRYFLPNEESRGARALVLSYRAWRQRFGGATDIVGRAVRLSGDSYSVVGVLPADFQFAPLGEAEFWTLLDVKNACLLRRSCHNLNGIARLKPTVSLAMTLVDLSGVARQLERAYPESNRERGVNVEPLAEVITGSFRSTLLLLMGGAGMLLLIACANVSGLLLARSESRAREIAVRAALGASRGRLYSQFAAEGLTLTLGASALALLFATLAVQGLKKLIPAEMAASMPFLQDLGLNGQVLVYVGAFALLAITLFTVAPTLHSALSGKPDALMERSRGSSNKAWRRLGSRLVIAELATAMVLLVGAGLLTKSLYRLLHVSFGFRADHLALIDVACQEARAGTNEQSVSLVRRMLSTVETIPGVQSAAVTTLAPVTYNGNTDWIRIAGRPYNGKHIEVNERDVSSDFFKTIGAKLLRGRYFSDTEDLSKPKVAIINKTLANRYFPGEDPVGKRIGDTNLTPASIWTIVGVIDDIRDGSLDSAIWPTEYHAFNQDPSANFVLIARTSQKPEFLLSTIDQSIHQLRPEVGLSGEATMENRIRNSTIAYLHRSSAWLVGGFATVALLLAIVGLYGVVAYSVSQRTNEIGIRMALGAKPHTIYRMILGEVAWLVSGGIVLGALCGLATATFMQKMLFGLTFWDLQTLIGVTLTLVIAALVASFAPARKAVGVNPVVALRAE